MFGSVEYKRPQDQMVLGVDGVPFKGQKELKC